MIYSSTKAVWEETNTIPFDELILSWNGIRPKTGMWTFFVSVNNIWHKMAEWGATSQRSFENQDTIALTNLATSFQVKVEGPDLSNLHKVYVCLSNTKEHKSAPPKNLSSVLLKNVPLKSQLTLDHPRKRDLCSPTALSTASSFLSRKTIDPIDFAKAVRDETHDIYGNWVLNVAESYNRIQHPIHVERLPGFETVHAELEKGRPVVVSVKGKIKGAPKEYPRGHLICIVGYTPGKIHCIDSAFAEDASTAVAYDETSFLSAWGIRRNLAYIFSG